MDISKQIRTLALGAALTFSAVGMPALHAFAAMPPTGSPLHAPLLAPGVTADLSGHSTGEGSATEEDCQGYAGDIAELEAQAAAEQVLHGRSSTWVILRTLAQQTEEDGVAAGCTFTE